MLWCLACCHFPWLGILYLNVNTSLFQWDSIEPLFCFDLNHMSFGIYIHPHLFAKKEVFWGKRWIQDPPRLNWFWGLAPWAQSWLPLCVWRQEKREWLQDAHLPTPSILPPLKEQTNREVSNWIVQILPWIQMTQMATKSATKCLWKNGDYQIRNVVRWIGNCLEPLVQ